MILPFTNQIWFYPNVIDFRKQLNGLMMLVIDTLGRNPGSGELFIFRDRTGKKLKMICYDITQRINFQPEIYEIIEERREGVTCKQHCEGSAQTAKAPKRFLPKTGVTESFIANIIVSKFDDRQPLYYQERRLKSRFGIQLSRQNMARWIICSAAQLMPLYNLMIDSLMNYDAASMDEPTIQVLDEPGRAASTESYMYCFRGGGEKDHVILYDYNDIDHQSFVANWYEGFSGYSFRC